MINIHSLYNLLILDIETVPQVSNSNELSAEGLQLFVEKISKTVPENFDEAQIYKQKAGILAEFGKVICISTAYFYEDEEKNACLKMKSISGDDEGKLLHAFIDLVNKFSHARPNFQFAGHNIREFDIPYLCRRMIINAITLPKYLQIHGAKPWEIHMVDTLHWWRFGDYKHYTSLHLLASILGIATSKDDIDGSMVQDVYYKDKDLPRIVNYCQKDVVVVAQIIRRFQNLPQIQKQHITVVE